MAIIELATLPATVNEELSPSQASTQVNGAGQELTDPPPIRSQVIQARVQLAALSWSV